MASSPQGVVGSIVVRVLKRTGSNTARSFKEMAGRALDHRTKVAKAALVRVPDGRAAEVLGRVEVGKADTSRSIVGQLSF